MQKRPSASLPLALEIVTTKTKAGAQSFGFTQEEADQYELMHATRDRAAARKKEIHEELPEMKADVIHEELPEMKADVIKWQDEVKELEQTVKTKWPIENSMVAFFDWIKVCPQEYNYAFVGGHICNILMLAN